MRKIKEVLRLRFELGLGQREIARAYAISHVTHPLNGQLGQLDLASILPTANSASFYGYAAILRHSSY
jgi:hypothetical protein